MVSVMGLPDLDKYTRATGSEVLYLHSNLLWTTQECILTLQYNISVTVLCVLLPPVLGEKYINFEDLSNTSEMCTLMNEHEFLVYVNLIKDTAVEYLASLRRIHASVDTPCVAELCMTHTDGVH